MPVDVLMEYSSIVVPSASRVNSHLPSGEISIDTTLPLATAAPLFAAVSTPPVPMEYTYTTPLPATYTNVFAGVTAIAVGVKLSVYGDPLTATSAPVDMAYAVTEVELAFA